jgi:hypothetical protein
MPGFNQFDRPIGRTFAITPSDTVNLPSLTRQLRVTVAGDVAMTNAVGGRLVTQTLNLTAGVHNIAVVKVFNTGTTATGLVGIG